CRPDWIHWPLVHARNTQFIPHVAGLAGIWRGDEDHCMGFANSSTQGFFPIRSARWEPLMVPPAMDALRLEIRLQSLNKLGVSVGVAQKNGNRENKVRWPVEGRVRGAVSDLGKVRRLSRGGFGRLSRCAALPLHSGSLEWIATLPTK